MSPRKRRRIDPARRGELEIAAAVAREAVLQLHVSAVLRLIEIASERVHASRILSIYLRLHNFDATAGLIVGSRVLAQLGQRSARGTLGLAIEGDFEADEESGSLLRLVRDRLRGRVHHDLRRWIELHTGQTRLALLELHKRHAEKFVHELAETHSIAEAVEFYNELVGVPSTLREVLYFGVLDRLADRELPGKAQRANSGNGKVAARITPPANPANPRKSLPHHG